MRLYIDISSKCNIQCTGHSKNQYPMYRKPPKAMSQCTTTFSIFYRLAPCERRECISLHLNLNACTMCGFFIPFLFINSESIFYKFKDRLHLNACKPHAGYRHLSSYFVVQHRKLVSGVTLCVPLTRCRKTKCTRQIT